MATLHPKMFIAQATLEAWMDGGRARLEGSVVDLERARAAYALEPAVRFVSAIGDSETDNLVGKVLSQARVVELGGEVLGDSVLFGDVAFQIEPGFIGTRLEAPPSAEGRQSV